MQLDLAGHQQPAYNQVFRLRPRLYAHWIFAALALSLSQLTDWPWLWIPPLLCLLSLPIALRRRPPPPDGEAAALRSLRRRALLCLMIGALAYYALYTLSVSLVSFPFERYFLSTIVLIPSAFVALLAGIWADVRRQPAEV